MPHSHAIRAVVLTVLFCSGFHLASHAALLAEIGINIPPTFDPSPPAEESLLYDFSVFSNVPSRVGSEWQRQVSAADVGMTFEAPLGIVDPIAQAFARPPDTVGVSIRVDSWVYSRPLDQLQSVGWEIPDNRATFRQFVPDITKVPVHRVTMTIDSYFFERFGNNGTTGGGHTIRIYGVPEPSTWILLITGSIAGHSLMRL